MDNFGNSAIAYLFQQRRKDISDAELIKFIRRSQRDTCKNLFHNAAEVASPDLDQWNEVMESQDTNGRTPLSIAILAGRPELAQKMLRHARPGVTLVEDHSKMIPLMHAAAKGLEEIVEELFQLEKEAAKKRDDNGRTALHCALDKSQDKAAAFLLNATDYEETKRMDESSILIIDEGSILITACKKDCVLSVKVILSKWPGLINEADEKFGQTPLAWACEYDSVKAVRALLGCKGVDPNIAAKGYGNYTPLHFAVRSRKVKIVRYLTKHPNIDFSLKDESKYTPLHIAIENDDSEIIQSLCIEQPNITQATKSLADVPNSTFAKLLPEILTKFKDDAISDDDISSLVKQSVKVLDESQEQAPLAACLKKVAERDTWKKLELSCHRAAQIGEFSIVKQLLSNGANSMELDEDNWSWVDCGRRYSDKDIDSSEELSQTIHDLGNFLSQNQPKGPSTFALDEEELRSVRLTPCETPGHNHQTSTCTGKYKQLPSRFTSASKFDISHYGRYSDCWGASDHAVNAYCNPTSYRPYRR